MIQQYRVFMGSAKRPGMNGSLHSAVRFKKSYFSIT
jgi:hypothetical protein